MLNNFELDISQINSNIAKNDKPPNLKEFIKYLNQTLNMFDKHVADEDFEKKDSDVYKLFTILFNIYADLDSKYSIPENIINEEKINNISMNETKNILKNDEIDINSIIVQHIENKKKQKNNTVKWENNRSRIESDKIAREIYNKSMLELCTPDDNNPIIFTEDKNIDDQINDYKLKNNNKLKNDNKLKNAIYNNIDTDRSNSDIYTNHDENELLNRDDKLIKKEILDPKPRGGANVLEIPICLPGTIKPKILKNQNEIKKKLKEKEFRKYEKTDDIDKKINNLKRMLNN